MTEPQPPRAVPGPPRPGPGAADADDATPRDAVPAGQQAFDDLEERPVAEHVAVYEAEHAIRRAQQLDPGNPSLRDHMQAITRECLVPSTSPPRR